MSLHYRKRERVSVAESYGFRSSPGGKGDPYRRLEKPFAFMNLCDYFICPEEEEESLGTLAAKTMNMKLLAEDCTTEMPYSFQAMSWNEEQSGKLDELIEGKRTSDE